jgi:ParB family transcriptional regulator, chromosome partitioning protein
VVRPGIILSPSGKADALPSVCAFKRKQIKKNEPVRCVLDTEHDAHEISDTEHDAHEIIPSQSKH